MTKHYLGHNVYLTLEPGHVTLVQKTDEGKVLGQIDMDSAAIEKLVVLYCTMIQKEKRDEVSGG